MVNCIKIHPRRFIYTVDRRSDVDYMPEKALYGPNDFPQSFRARRVDLVYTFTDMSAFLPQGFGGRNDFGFDDLTPALQGVAQSASNSTRYHHGLRRRRGPQTLIAASSLRSMLSIKPGNTSPA